jgi:transposase
LRNDRIDARCLFDGPINGERFHAYDEQFLVPPLKPGDVVILDNLGSHKGKAVRKAIREVGARLVFLPKYSPTSTPSSRSSPSSKLCCERREREATRRSPTQNPRSVPTRRMRRVP